MKKFLQDLFQGKFAISYTLTTIGNMVPREIKWLNKMPILGEMVAAIQIFWFITKILFFVMVISWFKPQYNHVGAKIFLFVMAFGLIFFAGWLMKKELNRRKIAK